MTAAAASTETPHPGWPDVTAADLALAVTPLAEEDRARLCEYWARVIEAAMSEAVDEPFLEPTIAAPARPARREVRRRAGRLARSVPKAQARMARLLDEEVA